MKFFFVHRNTLARVLPAGKAFTYANLRPWQVRKDLSFWREEMLADRATLHNDAMARSRNRGLQTGSSTDPELTPTMERVVREGNVLFRRYGAILVVPERDVHMEPPAGRPVPHPIDLEEVFAGCPRPADDNRAELLAEDAALRAREVDLEAQDEMARHDLWGFT